MAKSYENEKPIAGFSHLFNAGIRVTLSQDFSKSTNLDYTSLSSQRLIFQLSLAKSIGSENGFKKYAWTKNDGAITLRFSVNGMMAFGQVLYDYCVNGENSIYERPLEKKVRIVYDESGKIEQQIDNPESFIYGHKKTTTKNGKTFTQEDTIIKTNLKTTGFSRVIGQAVKKTYRIVLNTEHYKDKTPTRSIGIIASEGSNKCALSLEIPEALSLALQIINICNFAMNEDLKIQLASTKPDMNIPYNSSSSSNKSNGTIPLSNLNDERTSTKVNSNENKNNSDELFDGF